MFYFNFGLCSNKPNRFGLKKPIANKTMLSIIEPNEDKFSKCVTALSSVNRAKS